MLLYFLARGDEYMMIFSLNVNGLNSSLSKGLREHLVYLNPDIICLQEIKCSSNLLKMADYYEFYNFCNKKGYSGTAILSKYKPLSVSYNFVDEFDCESRIITLEYEEFYLVNVYFPTKSSIRRSIYRIEWDELFEKYIFNLECKKPVIICGDFNVSVNKESNSENKEFINNEEDVFLNLLNNNFVDIYKEKHPTDEKITWCVNDNSNRLDYFLISRYLLDLFISVDVLSNINCSDHFPITLELDMQIGD
jgi:exodeoxyribonuclease-3